MKCSMIKLLWVLCLLCALGESKAQNTCKPKYGEQWKQVDAGLRLLWVQGGGRNPGSKTHGPDQQKFFHPSSASYKDPKTDAIVMRPTGRSFEKYKTDGSLNDDEYPCTVMMSWTAGVFGWCYRQYDMGAHPFFSAIL